MALNVISNYAANVAHRNLVRSDSMMTDSLAKLSSGTRVVSAKDDAASMAIGSRLAAEVAALQQAQVNAGQAVSMLQVADGAMARAQDILMRMKTLAVQAGSGQLSGTERGMLNTEYQQLVSEVDRLAQVTKFNGNQLVNGAIGVDRTNAAGFSTTDGIPTMTFIGSWVTSDSYSVSYSPGGLFTVGDNNGTTTTNFTGSIASNATDGTNMTTGTVVTLTNSGSTDKIDLTLDSAFTVNTTRNQGTLALSGSNGSAFSYKVGTGTSPTADEITVTVGSISAAALGIANTDVTSTANADTASVAISLAVDNLNNSRADLGAAQNRLGFATANIATTLENTEAARSSLLDLDVASEMSKLTSQQILVQAGIAMLAQANQEPQMLLKLFQ
jgi:flagellin